MASTPVCGFFLKNGVCTKPGCTYSHVKSANYKPEACKNFLLTGACPYGARCFYSHEGAVSVITKANKPVTSKPSFALVGSTVLIDQESLRTASFRGTVIDDRKFAPTAASREPGHQQRSRQQGGKPSKKPQLSDILRHSRNIQGKASPTETASGQFYLKVRFWSPCHSSC